MPICVPTPEKWKEIKKDIIGSIGFVPTMGNLHDGHMELVKRAASENDHVIVSIFVNKTQFNDEKDYSEYKRSFDGDCKKLDELNVSYVFNPEYETIYPENYEIQISENIISNELEGQFRPGHFTGMLTVVLKLLNIMGADKAYFGEKDFQQLLLIKKMAKSLFLSTKIIGCPTYREEGGLAYSSRNGFLNPDEESRACLLYKNLQNKNLSNNEVKKALEKEGFKIEYLETKWGRRLIAAWLGNVRLIDNVKE